MEPSTERGTRKHRTRLLKPPAYFAVPLGHKSQPLRPVGSNQVKVFSLPSGDSRFPFQVDPRPPNTTAHFGAPAPPGRWRSTSDSCATGRLVGASNISGPPMPWTLACPSPQATGRSITGTVGPTYSAATNPRTALAPAPLRLSHPRPPLSNESTHDLPRRLRTKATPAPRPTSGQSTLVPGLPKRRKPARLDAFPRSLRR